MPNVVARRRPQLPGRDAASVPARIAVGTLVAPQIAMPSEPEHRLAAHTAIAWPLGMGLFAKRRRRRAKPERCPRRYLPGPAFRRAAQRRERAGELVGPDRMLAPIGFNGAARGRRNERAGAGMQQHGCRKNLWKIALQASERLGVSLRAPRGLGHVDSRLGDIAAHDPTEALPIRSRGGVLRAALWRGEGRSARAGRSQLMEAAILR